MGSFANVLVVRLFERTSLLGRSACPHCRSTLHAHHLVPIFSWIFLRGRCAFCHARIHFQYPLIELVMGLLAIITFWRHPIFFVPLETAPFLFEFALLFVLIILVGFDLRWKVLPLELMIITATLFALWNGVTGALPLSSLAIGMIVGLAFLGVQVLLSRGVWMGSGDPWMGMLMGAALGWPRVGIALYFSYVVGGGILIVLLVLGIVKRKSRVPFAPLLAGGTMLALWFGAMVETWMRTIF